MHAYENTQELTVTGKHTISHSMAGENIRINGFWVSGGIENKGSTFFI
jgi:hypothetical protein